jgi:soluble lytic murein transglycosylase-like protein
MYLKYLETYGNIKTQVFDAPVNSKRTGTFGASSEKNLRIQNADSETLRALLEPEVNTNPESRIKESKPTTIDPEAKVLEQYLNGEPLDGLSSGYIMGRLALNGDGSELPTPLLGAPERLLPPAVPEVVPEEVISGTPNPPTPFVIKSDRVSIREAAPEDIRDFVTGLVDDAAKRFELDSALGLAIIETESSFDPKAVSRDGHKSKGLFQLLDSTGREVLERSELSRSYDPYDPSLNVELGMRHLRRLIDIFASDTKLTNKISTFGAADQHSREKLAIAAFNAGEGRVAWAQKQAKRQGEDPGHFGSVKPFLPDTTRSYVDKVIASRQRQKVASVVG